MAEAEFLPDEDAAVSGVNTSTNYGGGTNYGLGVAYFGGGKSDYYRLLQEFDVSALAGETLQTARLRWVVYDISGTGGVGVLGRRITRPGDWPEGSVTWAKYNGTDAWTVAGGDYTADLGVSFLGPSVTGEFDVGGLVALVEDAIANRGGLLSLEFLLNDEAPASSHEWKMHSTRSAVDALRPRLIVEYGDVVNEPGVATGRRDPRAPGLAEQRPAAGASEAVPPGGITPARGAAPAKVREFVSAGGLRDRELATSAEAIPLGGMR